MFCKGRRFSLDVCADSPGGALGSSRTAAPGHPPSWGKGGLTPAAGICTQVQRSCQVRVLNMAFKISYFFFFFFN